MIPNFPSFKKIAMSDEAEIRSLVGTVKPYSDYNFSSLWSWNIDNEARIARLNGNLALRFTDYISRKHFYSFIGSGNELASAKSLFELSERENLELELKLICEEIAAVLKQSGMHVAEDVDNHDYILSVERLVRFEGGKFMSKRNYLKRFNAKIPNAQFRTIDTNAPHIQRQIIDLFGVWQENKGGEPSYYEHELEALRRYLELPISQKRIAYGVLNNEKLVAFWLLEFVGDMYCMSHFEKADVALDPGTYAFLINETAKALTRKGIMFVNQEQDLGITGLRSSKQSLDPIAMLKKYTVRT